MQILIAVLIFIVIVIHLYIVWLEMLAWTTRGRKVFKQFKPELFEPTKALAANQGLYNGFLVAGLLWTYLVENAEWKSNISLFFLGCVIVAGIYGALTAAKKIFFIQAVPALIPFILIIIQKLN